MGQHSAHINIEQTIRIYDKIDQICDDIDEHKDDKEETMIYDKEKSQYDREEDKNNDYEGILTDNTEEVKQGEMSDQIYR